MSVEMQVSTAPAVQMSAEEALVLNAVSPRIISVTHSGTNTLVVIEDIDGQHTITIPDGQQGPQGEQGIQGEQGVQGETGATGNGIASVTLNADYTLTITYTNGQSVTTASIRGEQGETGPAGADGQDGADGVSPTVSVTDITGGHRVSITDANGTQTFDVMDGADGQNGQDGAPGQGVAAGGTTGQMLVKKTNTDYDTEWANPPSVPVTDVQVNGTSVLSNGVANVPLGGYLTQGVLGTDGGFRGIDVYSAGYLTVSAAGANAVKGGTEAYKPIVPSKQDAAAFYGLAKAAGDTTQSASSNAVGTYTADALVKIQKMLGIYKAPYRLIKTINITSNTYTFHIDRDDDNQEFSLTDVLVVFDGVKSNGTGNCAIAANKGENNISGATTAFVTMNNGYNTTAQTRTAELHIEGGRFFGRAMGAATTNTYAATNLYVNRNATGIIECGNIYELDIACLNYYYLSEGTIKIYGR